MSWLNYHHLLYFWTVAREGSIAKASEQLRLAQPTISSQIHALEETLGHKLFSRSGRGIVLTDFGRMVYRQAEEIFTLGRELMEAVQGKSLGKPVKFNVGIADVMPKMVAYRLLEPALHLNEPLRIICREDKPEKLLADLAIHELDLVLSDAPISAGLNIRAYNHLLGECSVAFFATDKLTEKYKKGFPQSLDGAPMLLPTEGTSLRRVLDHWFNSKHLRPQIVGEFDDSALLKAFGQAGAGIFAAPDIIANEIRRQYHVKMLGKVAAVKERFYAISVERRLKHPAVVAISQTARQETFI